MIFTQKQTSIFTLIVPVLLDQSNKTSWVFPALKSTCHFLPQSTVSPRSHSSSEANSSSCHRLETLPHLRVESSIISTDSNITDNITKRSLMYSRKSVGPRMDPQVTEGLSNWIFLWRLPIQNHLKLSVTEKRRNKARYLTWNFIRHKFGKKNSMPNPVRSLGYIKCYSSSSPRTIKSPSNSYHIQLLEDL